MEKNGPRYFNIAAGNIEDEPAFGIQLDIDFILGMVKIEGSVNRLLGIDKVH